MRPRPPRRRRWWPPLERCPRASRQLRKSTDEFQRPSGREPPMAKARAIVKRRKAVQNIRKITRTMELIATAKFRKALDRATEAEAFTRKIAELVADLGETLEHGHPSACSSGATRSSVPCCWCSRAIAGWPAATTATSCGWRSTATRTCRPRGSRSASRSPASAESTYMRFRKVPDRHVLHAVRGPPPVSTRSRSSPTGTSRCTSRARSTGSTWPTPSSSARRGRWRPSRRSCRSRPPTSAPSGRRFASPRPGRSTPRQAVAATPRRARSPTSSCPTPRASSRRSSRSRSRCGCSSASSTRPSASRSPGWSPCGERPRTPTTSIKSLTRQYNRARQSQITRELADIVGAAAALS